MANNLDINYGNINVYNIYNTYLFLFIFVVFIIYFTLTLIYKDEQFKKHIFYDFFEIFLGNPRVKKDNMKMEVSNAINKNENVKKYLNDVTTTYDNTVELEKNNLESAYNLNKMREQAKSNFDNAKMQFNETAKKMSEMIAEANVQHKYNTEVLIPEIKETYSKKLRTYVDSLARSLDIIRKQLYISYVTPNLVPFIEPFRKVYNSIYDSFMKPENKEFINKYYPKFDVDKKIKPFKGPQGGVQELTANFEASDKLQAIQGGMKQI
jgi:hypothetical protein